MQIAGVATMCLQRLAAMLLQVCQNPTQPGFNHYLFESVAALIKYSAAADVGKVAELEENLFPAFNIVLQQDVQASSTSNCFATQSWAAIWLRLRLGTLPCCIWSTPVVNAD